MRSPQPARTKAKQAKAIARSEAVESPATAERVLGLPTGAVRRAKRIAAGRALRTKVPWRAHALWKPARGRPDPVAVLEAQGRTRLADLLPIRYGRMVESPFGFYRGAAAVMAADLAKTPRSGITVQVCGDAHLVNFGMFATPERHVVFDVNDFDETLPGPWEWDLKRLATSLVVAARARGASASAGDAAVAAASAVYRKWMAEYATLRTLDVWYARIDVEEVAALAGRLAKKARTTVDVAVARARAHDGLQAIDKLTELSSGKLRIKDQPPLIEHVPGEDELGRIGGLFSDYCASLHDDTRALLSRFSVVDAARKVVGVGSVGTRCWIVLLVGGGVADAVMLQVKEAEASVLEPAAGASVYENHGRRAVEGQRLMQAASDLFLGWARDPDEGVDYYWRQLHDMKGSIDIAGMTSRGFIAYGGLCAWVLARAHARTGDAAAISGYLGSTDGFDTALCRFARAYADQNERDHAALVKAVKRGRIPVEAGV
ncbi:MAG TPA: DUF2252 domain-containing protein [Candidatus Dormibacteraeota bacterium]